MMCLNPLHTVVAGGSCVLCMSVMKMELTKVL
jgi:hypothetical protein